jgi:3-dehydroquinate synthase
MNLGGGVICDMGGFCASTYKRGIDFINLPTTLLAQVDASAGGKLGIDFQGFKNHIGLFSLPVAVLIDPGFLNTLPERELKSGFAEVIKHCLIADHDQWEKVKEVAFQKQPWKDLIAHSISIKSSVVLNDPREKGLRKILNFGHTLGHAIETYFLGTKKYEVLHGEAVAAGMICEIFLSEELLKLNSADADSAVDYLYKTYGKLGIESQNAKTIISLAQQDKKNEKGELRFSLLPEIGKASFNIPVSKEQAEKAMLKYCGL